MIRRLAADAAFISPFSSWTAGADVRAAYQARALAVTDVTVTSSAAGDDVGVVAWRGRTGQYTCEGVDILTLTAAGAIARADVFLRPAERARRGATGDGGGMAPPTWIREAWRFHRRDPRSSSSSIR